METADETGVGTVNDDNSGSNSDESSESEAQETDINLDAEIARLLEADTAAGEMLNFDDIDFINDVSVFDRERRSLREAMIGAPASEAPLEEETGLTDQSVIEAQSSKKPKKPIIIGIILASCVILASGAIFFLSRGLPHSDLSGRGQDKIPVRIPSNAINNASYIFFNDEDTTGSLDIKLKKMAYGQLSSIFYFIGGADAREFSFKLSDQSGKTYPMDMTLRQPSDSVIFRPFDAGVTDFALDIKDNRSDRTQTLLFSLKDRRMMPARYINMPVDISPEGKGTVLIESAVFTNTGSTLQIRFQNKSDNGVNITPETRITMMDGAYSVPSRDPADGLYSDTLLEGDAYEARPAYTNFQDEGVTLARVDFEPVRGLNDDITLSVKRLNRLDSPQITLNTADLFDFAQKGSKELMFDYFNLIIEGMQTQGDVIALVMHGEDSETRNRVEVQASVELHAKDRLGYDIIIRGECKSGPKGTDVRFKVGDNPVIKMNPELIQLKFNSIETVLNDIIATLKLSELDSKPSVKRRAAKDELENMFGGAAQTDLIFLNGGVLVGSVLQMPDTTEGGTPLVHLVSAAQRDERWVVYADNTLRVTARGSAP
jgi:hypothetical protein